MKYMLMMHPFRWWAYEIMNWSKQDIEAHMAFMHRLNKKLADEGELVGGGGSPVLLLSATPMERWRSIVFPRSTSTSIAATPAAG